MKTFATNTMRRIVFILLCLVNMTGWAESTDDAPKRNVRRTLESEFTHSSEVSNDTHAKIKNLVVISISDGKLFDAFMAAIVKAFEPEFRAENIAFLSLPLSKQAFETGDELDKVEGRFHPTHYAILEIKYLVGPGTSTDKEDINVFEYNLDITDGVSQKVVWKYKARVTTWLNRADKMMARKLLEKLKEDGLVDTIITSDVPR